VADVFVSFYHAIRNAVATHNTTKNVDQDRFYVRIFQNNAETSFYGFGVCSTPYIQEVSRLATRKLDNIHSSHSQTSAVYHATHVSVKFYIVQVVLAGFYFQRIFFSNIAQVG